MYTPAEEYEVKVTREFIHEIQKKMQEKAGHNPDKEPVSATRLLPDFCYPVTVTELLLPKCYPATVTQLLISNYCYY